MPVSTIALHPLDGHSPGREKEDEGGNGGGEEGGESRGGIFMQVHVCSCEERTGNEGT